MIESSKPLFFAVLASLALASAGCPISADGQIPCVEDVSCPNDYPVCGPAGKCIAGTSTAKASVAIVGAEGHAASDYLSGTVRVIVSARATAGVQSVQLASGTVNFTASTAAATPPLYAFDVNTATLSDGDAALTATLTAGDGSTGTANGTLHVDNATPLITAFTVAGGTTATITSGKTLPISASFTGGTANITSSGGGSVSVTSGASVLVSPDVATTYQLRVTSRSGIVATSGTTGQPADVTVSVVSPASFTGNFTVSPSQIPGGQSTPVTFTAPTFGSSVTSAVVKDGGGTSLGSISSTGTLPFTIPAQAPGTTQLVYTLVLSNGATTPDTVTIPVAVAIAAAPVVSSFAVSTVHTTSGSNVTFSLDVTGVTTGTPSVTGVCSPAATVPTFNITLASGSGSAVRAAPAVAATSTCTYTVTVQNGTASALASQAVTVEPPPTISSFVFRSSGTTTAPFALGDNVDLDYVYDAHGGSASINGLAAPGTTTQFTNIRISTTYTLTVTNLAGATVTAAATATIVPGSWSELNNLGASARKGVTVTALDNGKVLIAGGTNTTGTPLGTAVVCDATGKCDPTTNAMTVPRAFHTAVKIGQATPAASNAGKVLIAGGYTAAGPATPTTAAEFYDPSTNSFASVNPITTPGPGGVADARARHVAVLLGDNRTVLIAGGMDGAAAPLSSAVKYDAGAATPAASDVAGPMKRARADFTATLLNTGHVLVVGGKVGDLAAELFDPAAGSGTFNLTTNSLPSGQDKRAQTAVLIHGLNEGRVVISGGLTGAGAGTASSSQVLYDPGSNPALGTFVAVAALRAARSNHAATSLTTNHVLLCGGTDGTSTLASCERYDPDTGSQFPTGRMLQPRRDFGLARINIGGLGEELAAGGTDSASMTVAETYNLNAN
jgi:hypothetical protein